MADITQGFISNFRSNLKKNLEKRYYGKDGLFGNEEFFFDCVYVAYLDACRKFDGIGVIGKKKDDCIKQLAISIKNYFAENPAKDEKSFDKKQKELCNCFIESLYAVGYKITYGMAQKVVNISFKNLYCFATDNYKKHFEYCHMALDDYILRWYNRTIAPKDNKEKNITQWSKLEDYEIYGSIQKNIREYLKSNPIDGKDYSILVSEFLVFSDEFTYEALELLNNTLQNYPEEYSVNQEIKNMYKNSDTLKGFFDKLNN